MFSREQEDALWHQVFTAQPARRREFEPSSHPKVVEALGRSGAVPAYEPPEATSA